jgi:2-keto-4-pentenoate hydratase/2-oxohepta-3-ene-1,7-dioic acid hydratase in catechol pathway
MKFLGFIDSKGDFHKGYIEADGKTVRVVLGDILQKYDVTDKTYLLSDIRRYCVPVDVPNVIAIGLNYTDHASELKMAIPSEPVIFFKPTTTINAHLSPVVLPQEAPCEVDFEAELCVIIGKKAKHIAPEQVPGHIFGYTCANDITARDCALRRDRQWARGKAFDTFCPIGPVIVTELDPSNLEITFTRNGEILQHSNTHNFIFPIPQLVSFISRNMTLLPGTLILTGTPPGVGYARKPPVYLRAGDTVAVEIEGIGKLENYVVAES